MNGSSGLGILRTRGSNVVRRSVGGRRSPGLEERYDFGLLWLLPTPPCSVGPITGSIHHEGSDGDNGIAGDFEAAASRGTHEEAFDYEVKAKGRECGVAKISLLWNLNSA